MKQKVVVKVSMNEHKKARSKAMRIAVSVHGVESASLQGADKDQIAVTGEGIDSVELTHLLRKNVGHTELLTVGPVDENKDNPTTKAAATIVQTNGDGSVVWSAHPYYYGGFPVTPLHHIYDVPPTQPPSSSCSIM